MLIVKGISNSAKIKAFHYYSLDSRLYYYKELNSSYLLPQFKFGDIFIADNYEELLSGEVIKQDDLFRVDVFCVGKGVIYDKDYNVYACPNSVIFNDVDISKQPFVSTTDVHFFLSYFKEGICVEFCRGLPVNICDNEGSPINYKRYLCYVDRGRVTSVFTHEPPMLNNVVDVNRKSVYNVASGMYMLYTFQNACVLFDIEPVVNYTVTDVNFEAGLLSTDMGYIVPFNPEYHEFLLGMEFPYKCCYAYRMCYDEDSTASLVDNYLKEKVVKTLNTYYGGNNEYLTKVILKFFKANQDYSDIVKYTHDLLLDSTSVIDSYLENISESSWDSTMMRLGKACSSSDNNDIALYLLRNKMV